MLKFNLLAFGSCVCFLHSSFVSELQFSKENKLPASFITLFQTEIFKQTPGHDLDTFARKQKYIDEERAKKQNYFITLIANHRLVL